jgi:hypothetical protein
MQEERQRVVCGLAIAGIITALLFFIPLLGVVGLILGISALRRISRSDGALSGRGLAIAAVIIGSIRTGLLILTVILIGFKYTELKEAYNQGRYEAISLGAQSNLKTIHIREEVYKANEGTYVNCPKNPAQVPAGKKETWQSDLPGWSDIDFSPYDQVYFQYEVTNATEDNFTATATGDLDGDGIYSKYTISKEGEIRAENEYE